MVFSSLVISLGVVWDLLGCRYSVVCRGRFGLWKGMGIDYGLWGLVLVIV